MSLRLLLLVSILLFHKLLYYVILCIMPIFTSIPYPFICSSSYFYTYTCSLYVGYCLIQSIIFSISHISMHFIFIAYIAFQFFMQFPLICLYRLFIHYACVCCPYFVVYMARALSLCSLFIHLYILLQILLHINPLSTLLHLVCSLFNV
jgi:hypothetical protein